VCGIAGILSSEPVDNSGLTAMMQAIAHRGPDDEGWLLGTAGEGIRLGRHNVPASPATVALGHRRLSVLDLAPTAAQPMTSPDGRLALTYNGEIYNYVELRTELESGGWRFRSTGDTEVLLAGWSTWGHEVLSRVTGMFAFCMVDFQEQRAYLVRDHFGIKPLFIASDGRRLVFASELGALLAHPSIPRVMDPETAYSYLRFGLVDDDERTFFKGVTRLPAATYEVVDLTDVRHRDRREYWQLPSEEVDWSFPDAVEAVRSAFQRSVRLHLRSDVPVGVALSGGLDSASIAAVVRAISGPDRELHCFSYQADDPRLNEAGWARLAADATAARLHPVSASPHAMTAELADLVRSQGEPFGGTSIYAQRRVFETAHAAGVKVMLDGQGADELFGGYRSYLAARFVSLLRQARVGAAARLAVGVARMPDVKLTPELALRALSRTVSRRLASPLLLEPAFLPWMNEAWFRDRGVEPLPRPAMGALPEALSAAFLSTSLPALLRYEDRNSMRYSIESRVPFLDRDFVELVFRLPRAYIIGADATTKLVFREAMRGIVPDAIIERRDKIGFTTPERSWLSDVAWDDSVLSPAPDVAWADISTLRAWTAKRGASRHGDDHMTWRCLNLALWQEVMVVNEPASRRMAHSLP